MAYSETLKANAYKWREGNKDKYNAYCNEQSKKYYDNNKERLRALRMKRYELSREILRLSFLQLF